MSDHECAYDTPGAGICETCVTNATPTTRDRRAMPTLVESIAQTLRHHVMGGTYCARHPWETSDHEPWLTWAQPAIDRSTGEGALRERIEAVLPIGPRPHVDLHSIGGWDMAAQVRAALAATPGDPEGGGDRG